MIYRKSKVTPLQRVKRYLKRRAKRKAKQLIVTPIKNGIRSKIKEFLITSALSVSFVGGMTAIIAYVLGFF